MEITHLASSAARQRAAQILALYKGSDLVGELYDCDEEFAQALLDYIGPEFEYPDHAHRTIAQVLGRRSPSAVVSDDDLCASCRCCSYCPGERSACAQGWPGHADDDGYCTSCDRYEPVAGVGHQVTHQSQVLVSEATGEPILVDSVLPGHRGHYRVLGGFAPRHVGSSGRVLTNMGEYYPSVLNAKWVPIEAMPTAAIER